MGVQLALLLAVPQLAGFFPVVAAGPPVKPPLGSGYSWTTRTRPSWMRGPPRSGAGYSWTFPGGMNRGYQQGQSWQRMGGLTRSGLGNRMGSPRYADYSRAGHDGYGGIGLSDLVCLLI